jgi:uncharacterized membrane protein YfcA
LDALHVVILGAAGLAGGFIAGLVGVGGGIVFAPVLFFFFQALGVSAEVIAPMTVGTSLLCTLLASSMSAYQHHRQRTVRWPVALRVGASSTVALYLVVSFVTTEPWYDREAFELVFGLLLAGVALKMFLDRGSTHRNDSASNAPRPYTAVSVGAIGSGAGLIAGLAGVGGGIVMVPAYHSMLRMPMHESVGTSSGAIVLISFAGVAGYALLGGTTAPHPGMVGYVDLANGFLLALPGLVGARLGATFAHRMPMTLLRTTFATIAFVVAMRLLYSGIGGF